jgi:hypothetical protein
MGALTAPFLALGLSSLSSIALGLALARWLGSVSLYAACRELGSSRIVAVMAATTYPISPYVLSNVYGRLAFPEAGAHMILCVLFYGLIRLRSRGDGIATAAVILSVVVLALAHPIFLLYGCAAATLFLILAMPKNQSLPGLGILFGAVCFAAFQWFPAMMFQSSFAAIFTPKSPYLAAAYSSPSGLFDFPKSLSEYVIFNDENYRRLFLTPSIATIPVLLFLLFSIRDRLVMAIAACLGASLLLVFPPFDLWANLPKMTWSLQFPYRALSFVALFVSIGIGLLLRHWIYPALLGVAVAIQSAAVLRQPFLSGETGIDQAKLPEIYASVDYRMVTGLPLISSDRWLNNDRAFSVSDESAHKHQLVLSGSLAVPDLAVLIWMAHPSTPGTPATSKYLIGPGAFSIRIDLPNAGDYILVFSNYYIPTYADSASADTRILSARIENAFLAEPGESIRTLPRSSVDRVYSHGYTRSFQIKPQTNIVSGGAYRIELPLSFSPLMRIVQDGHYLPVSNSINSLATVETTEPTHVIEAHYRLPLGVWLLMLLGVAAVFASHRLMRRSFQHGGRGSRIWPCAEAPGSISE